MNKTIELTEQEHKDLTNVLNEWLEMTQDHNVEYDEQDEKWLKISTLLFEKLLK